MSPRYLRPGVVVGHVLVLAAALICLRLGWWQWGVFEFANRGSVQNLGYALLWPVFAGAFIFMWLRFLHLESVRDAAADGGAVGEPVEGEDATGSGRPTGAGGADTVGDVESGPVGDPVDSDGWVVDGSSGDVASGDVASGDVAARDADADGPAGSPSRATEPLGSGDGSPKASVTADRSDDNGDAPDELDGDQLDRTSRRRRDRRGSHVPNESRIIAVATVGDDDDDDAELAAYNRALAELAEQDRRRAR